MVTKAAVRLHSKGELQRAIELYQQALSSETTDDVQFRLRINLACAYEEAEDLTASIEELRLALELNSQDPYTIYKLGRALTSVGELEEARTRLESIINLHPQAAVGLKILDKAVEGHKLEEARRATIAAAKTRRSPFEVLSPSVYCTSPRDPIALLAPIVQSPAPRSKKRRAAKRESAPPTAAAIEKSAPVVSKVPGDIESLPKPETTDAHLASPSLLEILVRRCREAGIDMLEVLKQLDPQQRGLVRRESFMGLLRVLAGIDTLDSDVVVSPDDWVTHKNQVLLHYGGFVQAYTEQYQVEAALVVSNEVGRVKLVIDDLIRNDLTSFSSHNVSEWMRSGCKRAIAELHRNSTLPAGVVLTDNDAAADSWKQSRGTEATRSAPELYTNVVNIFIPRSRARKGRAREEGLLAAEKARVLARRQQRCMKSLRDMASRAKAHIVSRRKAVAFLLMIAQNAVFKVKTRTREEEAVESHTSHDDEAASSTDSTELVLECTSNTVKELSKETYHESVRTAMTRVCPNAQLEDLKTLASHFAAFCQVPPFFLGVQVLKPDEAFGEAGNYDY
ncbi:Tetratricopeptide repeat [Phytophthora infestans]|uniref:Tetratricopeptide repeat n=1 Tax=Phytophthora infestans TaxID=4787 RepID=A0A833SQL7_PHYIN|nr:Tetratricopeptide repeat [Phytophthora infestans]